MPNYDFHKKFGLFFSLLFTLFVGGVISKVTPVRLLYVVIGIFVTVIYSNLPDIDHHMGRLRKKTFRIIFTLMALSLFVSFFFSRWVFGVFLTIVGLLGLILLTVKHRGPTHSYSFIFITSIPLAFIHWYFFWVAFIAGSSHIFIDRLWSWSKRKVKKVLGVKTTNKYYINGKKIFEF